jgi:hypothetical protein
MSAPEIVLEILQLAESLTEDQEDATVVNTVLQIVQKGVQVVEEYTGAPLDPQLLKAESPLP